MQEKQEIIRELSEELSWSDTLLRTIETLSSLQKEMVHYLLHEKADIQNLTQKIAETEILLSVIAEMRSIPRSVDDKKDDFILRLQKGLEKSERSQVSRRAEAEGKGKTASGLQRLGINPHPVKRRTEK